MRSLAILLLASLLFWACNNSKNATVKLAKSIVVEVKVADTTSTVDTLRLYAWKAIQAVEISKQPVAKTDAGFGCKFELGEMPRGMYYVGPSLRDMKPVLLGTEKVVLLEGTSSKMAELKPVDSKLNEQYDALMKVVQEKNQSFMTLLTEYNSLKGDKAAQDKVKGKMAADDSFKRNLLDSLQNKNSELARIMAFNTFQSYQNNGKSGQVEGTYFAESFFDYVDCTDTVYAYLPFYYENVKNYATALTQVGLKADEQLKALDSLLAKIPEDNANYKPTLVASMFGAMGRNNAIFIKYGKNYLARYKGDYAMLDKFVEEQLLKLKGAAGIGDEAANITGPNPEGKVIDLKSLRGKYVLIDFWASWCGPCRRENPNVVRLYNKYKSKGFEILGVSLDNKKDKWVAAIAKDKLTWPHVSDLKGWSSALAKPYGVKGIPYTVLVDKEGKILAKKLRGAALEAKLKSIFGE